jgi:hypothetical protein
MSYIHIVNGDIAAKLLTTVLRDAGRDETVIAMRDDLAIGPLRPVDDNLIVRAGFWQRVLGNPERDLYEEFELAQKSLAAIVDSSAEVVVWHGQSSGDQLLLRRIAYHLRNEPQRLNEIGLTARELGAVAPWPHGSASLGRYPEAALHARLKTIAPISLLRIGRLGLEWQELKMMNSDVRRWRTNSFESGTFAEIDTLILEHIDGNWQSAGEIAARIMAETVGFFASDTLINWRSRELAATGRLCIRGTPPQIRSVEVRSVASA